MKLTNTILLSLAILLVWPSCKRHTANPQGTMVYKPKYAREFQVVNIDDQSMLITLTPWQGSDSAIVRTIYADDVPKRVVCMSSTHVAMLDKLGLADRIVGVSGLDRITSPTVRNMDPKPVDIGFDNMIDYEKLQALKPDLVMLYGLNGPSPMERRLERMDIPYVYISEYLEPTPLGKAEWLVAVGELFDIRNEARKVFDSIPAQYDALVEKLSNARQDTATVMLNSPYGGTWMFPSMDSYAVTLLQDAGGKPAYDQIHGTASKPIDLEQAYMLSLEADAWLSPGQITTLHQLETQLPQFVDVPMVQERNVWNTIPDYWESGVVNPHLVLHDLINVLHPGVLPDSTMTYYYRLQ